MPYVLNDPDRFSDEARQGMVLAHSELLAAVPGGVMRATEPETPKVAVVIGGGSGHYPAFAGLVGPGLADAAAMGDVFASPGSRAVVEVASAVQAGRGVLLTFGNYAGDVINFERAAGLLRAQGIEVEIVRVTDDVASAPPEAAAARRGIAGDLIVFKLAGAAAEAGGDLAAVAEVARAANASTRTIGVAFGGITLPGQTDPLFTVPAGEFALGMGIHGEPGLGQAPFRSARELASILWDHLRDEVPRNAPRLVLLVNGLGAVKGEELYLFYAALHEVLERDGRTVAEVRVGEFATSFDMAGLSLTAAALDDHLFELWCAPAQSAAFVRGAMAGHSKPRVVRYQPRLVPPTSEQRVTAVPAGGDAGTFGDYVCAAFERVVATLRTHESQLGALDAVAGDGDHGYGMRRGAEGALCALHDGAGAASALLSAAGDGWEEAAGGTSGAIWGAVLRAIAEVVPPPNALDGPGFQRLPDGPEVQRMLDAAVTAIRSFGAELGERTMLDAAVGLAEGWRGAASESVPAQRWRAAAQAATVAAEATAAMTPKRGRARAHAGKRLDTPDPGATSLALIAGVLWSHR